MARNPYAKTGRKNSQLVYDGDPGYKGLDGTVYGKGATERGYQVARFDPATTVETNSYTSGRVNKRVYNHYKKNANYTVIGYYQDWSQYDKRMEATYDFQNPADYGRGIDLLKLDPLAYDKLIVGFFGIVGDKGGNKDKIDRAAIDLKKTTDQVTSIDLWADVAAYLNCGFERWVSNDYLALFDQSTAQGLLGGLRQLKDKNPDLILSFSVGGWTMSEAFYHVVRDKDRRAVFVESLVDIIAKFPMFTEIDIDWEYPGVAGNGNTYAPDDAKYFQLLVEDVKRRLPTIKISIATGASIDTLALADIPGMLRAGVETINLMTYDFFGSNWATELAHHTNLYPTVAGDTEAYSVDNAINYLLKQGVNPKNILIGYAGYSRNARGTAISSLSPLKGTYYYGPSHDLKDAPPVAGTFESGVTEWYDLIYNYLDLEAQKGINGFDVYTDFQANADYLFNKQSQLFISYDSPRTVRDKGRYVQEKGLGGMLTWTADQDNGVLVNAAREGLGFEISKSVIDMEPFYFYGINQDKKVKAVIDGPKEALAGQKVSFSGTHSEGTDLSYLWKAEGLDFIDSKNSVDVTGILPNEEKEYVITLTVTDKSNNFDTAVLHLKVSKKSDDTPTASIGIELTSGTEFAITAEDSTDPAGTPLSYKWSAKGFSFDGSTKVEVSGVVPSVTKPTHYPLTLVVSNGKNSSSDSLMLTALPSKDTPVKAVITGNTRVKSGDAILLSGSASHGQAPLSFSWNAPGLGFDKATSEDVTARAPQVTQDTTYLVSLAVADSHGQQDLTSVNLVVVAQSGGGDWVPKIYHGGDIVTHDYNGQGLHKYKAKWDTLASNEPGDPDCTSIHPDGDSLVWLDLGPV